MYFLFVILYLALIEERGTQPLLDIHKKLGGWPVIMGNNWDPDNKWSWIEAVKDFRKWGYSIDYIVDFSVTVNFKESTTRIINVNI